MLEAPTLRADGLVLRQLSREDTAALFAAHGDPLVHHFWSDRAHESVEETARYIDDTLAMKGARVWAITENGGEALGRVALFALREGLGEFGILMRRGAQGRGLASRAVGLVSDYAFKTLDMHRLMADVDPDNSASLSLFLRNGFKHEGLLRQNWKTHLGLRDSVVLARLRDEG